MIKVAGKPAEIKKCVVGGGGGFLDYAKTKREGGGGRGGEKKGGGGGGGRRRSQREFGDSNRTSYAFWGISLRLLLQCQKKC